jgi:hypothetical protein
MVCSARRGTRKVVIREKGGRRLLQGPRDLSDVLIRPAPIIVKLILISVNSFRRSSLSYIGAFRRHRNGGVPRR